MLRRNQSTVFNIKICKNKKQIIIVLPMTIYAVRAYADAYSYYYMSRIKWMPVIRLHKSCGTKAISYMLRCLKMKSPFYAYRELFVYHQGKHTKLKGLLNDEDFKEDCQAW